MPMQRFALQVSMFVSLLIALMCGANAAHAAGEPPIVEIERMTWVEIRDAIAAGKTTAIVPTGGTEQNGAHMVTGKHNFIVAETARRIALALGSALVAPVLAYVPEGDPATGSGHMAYPGTLSLDDDVFAAVLEGAAKSLKAAGFKTIVLLGDSGGNQAPQQALAEKLTATWANEGVRVVNAAKYYAEAGGDAWLASDGESKASIGTHAGIRDTSELMAVLPAGVRLEGAAPDSAGATGDPTKASAVRGEMLLALKVEAAVGEIRAAEEALRQQATARGIWARILGLFAG